MRRAALQPARWAGPGCACPIGDVEGHHSRRRRAAPSSPRRGLGGAVGEAPPVGDGDGDQSGGTSGRVGASDCSGEAVRAPGGRPSGGGGFAVGDGLVGRGSATASARGRDQARRWRCRGASRPCSRTGPARHRDPPRLLVENGSTEMLKLHGPDTERIRTLTPPAFVQLTRAS